MYGSKELLITIICDRTNEIDQAQEDLAVLGEAKFQQNKLILKVIFIGYIHISGVQ
ncbi:hypothetical protein J2T12_002265 [Paenibacillus anaericanus]|nr:hypothetical protein [Paenibacillus anaericanus]